MGDAEPAPPAPSPLLEAGGPMAATIMEMRELARLTDEELLDMHYREGDLAARTNWWTGSCRSHGSSRSAISTVANPWMTSYRSPVSVC